MEVPRPAPQPQERWIWAVSATYTIAHGSTGSVTLWSKPGIEPVSSWILVGFITAESQWQLWNVYIFIYLFIYLYFCFFLAKEVLGFYLFFYFYLLSEFITFIIVQWSSQSNFIQFPSHNPSAYSHSHTASFGDHKFFSQWVTMCSAKFILFFFQILHVSESIWCWCLIVWLRHILEQTSLIFFLVLSSYLNSVCIDSLLIWHMKNLKQALPLF